MSTTYITWMKDHDNMLEIIMDRNEELFFKITKKFK
jgi:hypothetical protein